MHVAARTLATHALSIFGDHSDVMHARATGWAMLSRRHRCRRRTTSRWWPTPRARSRVPFLHFFDGFRTSHEIDRIELLSEDDLRPLVRDERRAGLPRPRR